MLAKKSGYSLRAVNKAEAGGTLSVETIGILAEALTTEDDPVYAEDLITDQRRLARQFLDAYTKHGIAMLDHCHEIFDPDVVLRVDGDPDESPIAGEYYGLDGFQDFLNRFFHFFRRAEDSLFEQAEMLVSDTSVALIGKEKLCLVGTVPDPDDPGGLLVLHLHFSGGKIVRVDDRYEANGLKHYILDRIDDFRRLQDEADFHP
ncbi:MAG: nuclear transport factor 2 family protein [Planctomycetales bacterium]|nr:nuclear transport factor 2 family protein [Planctomycetales bacterium]